MGAIAYDHRAFSDRGLHPGYKMCVCVCIYIIIYTVYRVTSRQRLYLD